MTSVFLTFNVRPALAHSSHTLVRSTCAWLAGSTLKVTEHFKYMGSWVNSSEKDIKVRKTIVWQALNGMTRVWKSNLPRDTKLHFFEATVESALLY